MVEIRAMVGIPGSGKSTLAQRWLEAGVVDQIMSSDALREQMTGDAGDVSQDKAMWPIFWTQVHHALDKDRTVVIDATNLKPQFRRDVILIAEKYGVRPQAHIIQIDYATAQARNLARSRVVPEHVMKRMWQNFQQQCSPSHLVTEGFDVVVHRERTEVIDDGFNGCARRTDYAEERRCESGNR